MEGHFGEIAGTEINGSMGSIYDITLRETNIAGWKMDYLPGKMGMFMGELLVSGRVLYMYMYFFGICSNLFRLLSPLLAKTLLTSGRSGLKKQLSFTMVVEWQG